MTKGFGTSFLESRANTTNYISYSASKPSNAMLQVKYNRIIHSLIKGLIQNYGSAMQQSTPPIQIFLLFELFSDFPPPPNLMLLNS